MTEGRREEKETDKHRLARAFHLEAEPLPGGGMLLVIGGAKRLLAYTPSEILLGTRRATLRVCGQNLACRSFSSGILEIRGRVDTMHFGDREDGK